MNTESIMVDIKGAVHKPGIYTLEDDDRIVDVIDMAGGFTKQADEKLVNLAQRIQDEMLIYIPKKGESAEDSVAGDIQPQNMHQERTGIKVNSATQEELETLNGIGPSKAAAIIEYREINGPFKQLEDLLDISGIGEKTLESFKDDIILQ